MWQLWIDTGGTFTDGVAVGIDGHLRSVKILSSGALRGVVVRRLGPDLFRIRESWRAHAGLVEGLTFRLLGLAHDPVCVERYDPVAGELKLSAAPGIEPARGAPFEIVTREPPPVLAARLLTGTPASHPLPPCQMRLATTLGTNLLLERAGEPTVLFITRGLGDLLAIGTQQRAELFSLRVDRPPPLHAGVVEVPERLDARGGVLEPLALQPLEEPVRRLLDRGIRTAAVALLHSHRNPAHEHELKRRLLEWGFEHVSCSSELAPRIKLLERAQTSVVDAYLAPVLADYLARVLASLGGESGLLVLTSAGGLLSHDRFRPKDGLLSGPAGGVVGAALAGRRAGLARLISLDMGGTSTDVARYNGEYERVYEHRVGDAALVAPALAIETVAAGGGSICWLDDTRLCVGPRSAGAQPGPACYGAGGPLTLTDVNLLLGRLSPAGFEIPVRKQPARRKLGELRRDLRRRTGEAAEPEALLEGLLAIANETMADAIRRVSLRRGYDPADHALVAFGGAGGQHACALADLLGIRTVLVPEGAALLSARGLGHAVVERFAERQVLEPLERVEPSLARWFDALDEQAVAAVVTEHRDIANVAVRRRWIELRFAGQDSTLEVDWRRDGSAGDAFEQRHEELFGHRPEGRAVEIVALRVVASAAPPAAQNPEPAIESHEARPRAKRRAVFHGNWLEVACFARERLRPGARLEGPALVLERHSATVIEPGWSARVDSSCGLVLERSSGPSATRESRRPAAARLELFTQRLGTLVQEMGERLERTAVSTNVKERLDFSCALLDPEGALVVNAPHIPVHLGALGLCVRQLREALPMSPGDVVVTNHPAYGGSHLPDVTVVSPVHVSDRLIGYVANRAHHAEIGGIRPGSMPPAASCLAEEGVVIPPTYLVRHGRPRWEALRELLEQAPFPSRNAADNLSDIRAAVAANHAGSRALAALAAAHGERTLLHYMRELEELAGRRIQQALGKLGAGRYEAAEQLDDGTPLAVRIDVAGGRATFDFAGSGPVHPGNLNATPAIVRSAVIYVLRLLLEQPLPLNEGLLHGVTIQLPVGLLNPPFPDDPRHAPAVAGGNVETSQRLVDTLLKALGLAACSQGTMNNLIFGNERYGYYETLGGGCGAGPGFAGASGVHSHMTNTRITDIEVLEHRYPVRVERFALRRGSGGRGCFRGGDGLVRELRFLEPASLSILSQHRSAGPYGVAGGEPGQPGKQWIVRASGEVYELGSIDGCEVGPGDRLVVETPGGGGYGEPIGLH